MVVKLVIYVLIVLPLCRLVLEYPVGFFTSKILAYGVTKKRGFCLLSKFSAFVCGCQMGGFSTVLP